MSSFGAQMRKRLNELRKAGQDVSKIMAEVAEGATIEAIRVATENTPPNDGTIAGTNMRSGDLKEAGEESGMENAPGSAAPQKDRRY